jgi:hypothetical protein
VRGRDELTREPLHLAAVIREVERLA